MTSVLLPILVSGCACFSRMPPRAVNLLDGNHDGSYKEHFTDFETAMKVHDSLLKEIRARHGKEPRASKSKDLVTFRRWKQTKDHFRIDLYVDDLANQKYSGTTGYKVNLDFVNDWKHESEWKLQHPGEALPH